MQGKKGGRVVLLTIDKKATCRCCAGQSCGYAGWRQCSPSREGRTARRLHVHFRCQLFICINTQPNYHGLMFFFLPYEICNP